MLALVIGALFLYAIDFLEGEQNSVNELLLLDRLNLPAVWFDAAVIVFPFPISTTGFNALVVDKTNEPAPPITYPPEGAVCGFPESKFIVTPPAPTPCVFKSVIASDSVA